MNKMTSALSCSLVLALPAAALAQENAPDPLMEPAPDAGQRSEDMDANADGYLEKAEIPVEHELAQQFAAADADRDRPLFFRQVQSPAGATGA